jgi:hypothetical protein
VTIIPARIPQGLFSALWSLRRRLGMSPTQAVFNEIRRRGVPTEMMSAVEVFAGTGFRHTIDYMKVVGTLEVWEMNSSYEGDLRRHLPGATIRITDSFEELARTTSRFGIIVVDNTITTFGRGYVEHFDLFPGVFRVASDPCVLVLNVCPGVPDELRRDAHRMSKRAEFYRTDRPQDVPIDRMVEAYERLMKVNGFRLDWYFARKRAYREGIHYLVMRMTRSEPPAASAS